MFKIEIDSLAPAANNGDWVSLVETKPPQIITMQLLGRFTHDNGHFWEDVIAFCRWCMPLKSVDFVSISSKLTVCMLVFG